MNHEAVFSSGAELDLIALEDYLSERFSTTNAKRFVDRISQYCLSLGLLPYRGTNLERYRPGLRSVGFERRVTILFEVRTEFVLIVAVNYKGYTGRDPREM